MTRDPRAATIYATQLTTRWDGFPLWDPYPGNLPPVDIADVGYVRFGAWTRLFNASKPRGDPDNAKFGVPEDYQQLNTGEIQERSSLPGLIPILSESMTKRELETDVSLSGGSLAVQAGGGFSFKCSREQGAVLLLGDDADRRDAISHHKFIRHMQECYGKWLTFANDVHECGIRLNDLIFVTGCDKTSSWSCAVFSRESSEATVKFNVGEPGVAQGGVSMSWAREDCSAVIVNKGPQPKNYGVVQLGADTSMLAPPSPPRNQCVFLRGYRICDRKTLRLFQRRKEYDGFENVIRKRRDDPDDRGPGRSRRWPFVSNPMDSQGSSYGSEGHRGSTTSGSSRFTSGTGGKSEEQSESSTNQSNGFDWESLGSAEYDYPVLSQYKEPTLLDILLYYILENSTADLALVHDDDLIDFLQIVGSTTDVERMVYEASPKIFIDDKVGMLEITYRALVVSRGHNSSKVSHRVSTLSDAADKCPVSPTHQLVATGKTGVMNSRYCRSVVAPSRDNAITAHNSLPFRQSTLYAISLSSVIASNLSLSTRQSRHTVWGPAALTRNLLKRVGRSIERISEYIIIRTTLGKFERNQPDLLHSTKSLTDGERLKVQDQCRKLVDLCIVGMHYPSGLVRWAFMLILRGFTLPGRKTWSYHIAEAISEHDPMYAFEIFQEAFFALLDDSTPRIRGIISVETRNFLCPAVAYEIASIISLLVRKELAGDLPMTLWTLNAANTAPTSNLHLAFSHAIIKAGFLRLVQHWAVHGLPHWDQRGIERLEGAVEDIAKAQECRDDMETAKEAKLLLRKLKGRRLLLDDFEETSDIVGGNGEHFTSEELEETQPNQLPRDLKKFRAWGHLKWHKKSPIAMDAADSRYITPDFMDNSPYAPHDSISEATRQVHMLSGRSSFDTLASLPLSHSVPDFPAYSAWSTETYEDILVVLRYTGDMIELPDQENP